MLKLLWNRVVNFFSELPRPFLFIGTCSVFLAFIIGSQIAHSAKELKYLRELIVQERTIFELEEGLQWQDDIMMKQHEAIQEQGVMLQHYKNIIDDLVKELNKRLGKEEEKRPSRSEATNHEGKTKHKNMQRA